jgi:hypothetical protein
VFHSHIPVASDRASIIEQVLPFLEKWNLANIVLGDARDLAGNDRITGGGGSDVFLFQSGTGTTFNDGRDIITDFDANGGGSDQDYLFWDDVVDIRKSGKNTVVEYGDGDTVTLLDVKRSQIDVDDFHYVSD